MTVKKLKKRPSKPKQNNQTIIILAIIGGVVILCLTGLVGGMIGYMFLNQSEPAPVTKDAPQQSISIPTESVSAQAVIDKLKEAGIDIADVRQEEREADSPLPNSYTERLGFSISEVAPKGGQIFVCSTKQNCDALYVYFDALKGLGGPYYYQSPNGTVVAQMSNGLSPDTAKKIETVIMSLP